VIPASPIRGTALHGPPQGSCAVHPLFPTKYGVLTIPVLFNILVVRHGFKRSEQGARMKLVVKIILSAIVMLSVTSMCFADPPDPKPPQAAGATIIAPL
jgi:hypothetical protein